MNKQQWQPYVEAFRTSGMTKMAKAQSHGLVYSQFLSWSKKLSSSDSGDISDFVTVKVKKDLAQPKSSPALGTVEFPNATKLVIHSLEPLSLLPTPLR